jgi:hypothetical protein
VLAPETTTFLEGGCSLIVGTVGADGQPTATRGWGLTVLARDGIDCRLLLDAGATRAQDDLRATGVIAVTAADVPTLYALQLKGVLLGIEPGNAADDERAVDFAAAFFGDVHATDGTDLAVLQQLFPGEFVAAVVRFADVFDQTPGPAAGVALTGAASSGGDR